ncbi:MAG: hypothetical protein CL608_34305 [Anaerolineaceae bacterium]|jgi:hypothetical protein|nr:hypothetical protein [Anaerolineaceae bacterium]
MESPLTRDSLLEFHGILTEKARRLMERKNKDYAGQGGKEPFANFTRCESMGICSTFKGFLVRMTDKLSRLSSYSEAGSFAVEDEKLEDTIIDMINYSVLILAFVRDHGEDTEDG